MANSNSAIESEDDAASPLVTSEVDVLRRDLDDVVMESHHSLMGYDELHEILSWMSAKSAIKCSSSLCTWLRGIHSDPGFIKKQCIRSYGQENGFFLQPMLMKYGDISKDFEFHLLPWETGPAFGIPRESLDYLPNHGRILSSSNGLLLLGNKPSRHGRCEFMVCNPATRKWAPLPIPEAVAVKFDEDFSPLIECYPRANAELDEVEFPNDYTIVVPVEIQVTWAITQAGVVFDRKQPLLIYSNGKWEEELCDVTIEGWVVRYDTPVAIFSNATKGFIVHYLCDIIAKERRSNNLPDVPPGGPDYSEPYIVAFDIRGKKLLRQIRVPEEAFSGLYIPSSDLGGCNRNLWLFKWNETLCLLRWRKFGSAITAWVLDDYGCEGESWRLVVSTSEFQLWPDGDYDHVGDWIASVGVASGKGLLIATDPSYPRRPPDEIGSRVFLYRVEEEVDHGRLELVGKHSFGPGSFDVQTFKVFMPYANTLRPVSVQNAETCTWER